MPYPHLFGPATHQGWATSADGVGLHWQQFGVVRPHVPPVVCFNGLGCSTFFWHHLSRAFSTQTAVVVWDYRGHGDSHDPVTLEAFGVGTCADDAAAVMASAGLTQPCMLVGHSMGVQVILEFFRRYRAQVAALVPMLGTYGNAHHTFFNTSAMRHVFPVGFHITQRWYAPVQRAVRTVGAWRWSLPLAGAVGLINAERITPEDWAAYSENLQRMEPRLCMQLARDLGRHSALDVLPHVDVPTLVVAGQKDVLTPWHCSQTMRDRIRGAELLTVKEGSHAALVEFPDVIDEALQRFWTQRVLHR